MKMTGDLLSVTNLEVIFERNGQKVQALSGVSFSVLEGETLCLVGESGSGKSVACLSILRLLNNSSAKIAKGSIVYKGQDLLSLPPNKMRPFRGKEIGMIFQNPMTALNPVFSIGFQLQETLKIHEKISRTNNQKRCLELLEWVGIADPKQRLLDYPHQLSGGMKQRVMIALALACKPRLLLADEPTTALDVTVQATVLDLLKRLQRETGMSILMVTHDLGVVAEMADRVGVMKEGRILETSKVLDFFNGPRDPYSRQLLASRPGMIEYGASK